MTELPKAPPIRLHENEQIVVEVLISKWWGLARYVFTLGLWAFWRPYHRFILTNQRVIITAGRISKTERSAPLSRIQDAQLDRSPLNGGWVRLSTAAATSVSTRSGL